MGRLGPRGERKEGAREGKEGEKGKSGLLGWAATLFSSFLFFFCFSNSLIQTILIEFKYNLNSNLYTQHK
jgi:hypothetical protein